MVFIRKLVYKILWFYCILSVVLLINGPPCYSEVKIQALPNETNPNEILIENDSLFISLSLDWKLTVNSLRYKPRDVEFIQPGYPMPLVGIGNRWSLFNVSFGIRNVEIKRSEKESEVTIHAYSNYLENPFHIFILLTIGERAEIEAKIWLENRHKIGFHDMYRGWDDATSVVPGIPWLSFLSPVPGGERQVLYPTPEGYLLEKVSERLMEDYRPISEWEQPPKPGPVHLHFLWDPLLPTTIEFPGLHLGVFLYREKSDLSWHFDSIEEALWPSQTMEVGKGDTIHIFEGILRIFEGDWHQSYHWFKDCIRNDFDFTYYKRPGYERYRRHFLAYHSFVFNHMIYNPYENRFMPKLFLEKAKREFDGFDQFWFWHSYPRVGVDPRDQFDLFEDLPGGLDGFKNFITTCHTMGTDVYLAYNPWDQIRKRKDMYKDQAKILGVVGADGLLLDTMDKSDLSFRTEVDKYNPEAQFVTEGRPSMEGLQFTTSSWDHPGHSRPMPSVDLLRFILPEHQVFKIVRWDRDRKSLIYNALFNATGYAVWEDIFGEINLQSWDEKILISRYNHIMHDFAHVVISDHVMPLVPTLKEGLFVNGFFTEDMHLYTLYQTQHDSVSHFLDNRIIGALFYVDLPEGWHIVDVWNKRPVEIREIDGNNLAYLPQEMPEEVGCFFAMPERIEVLEKNGEWTAQIPSVSTGMLELIGVDITKRNQKGPWVDAKNTLTFNQDTVEQSPDGYVLVQYRNKKKEVKDVALVKVGY